MFWTTSIAASLLATGVHAGIGSLVAEGMMRNSPALERRMEEIAKSTLDIRSVLETRQSSGSSSTVVLNQDGTINMTAWDATATVACENALSHLPEASNPSGTCVCYNLPALNNVTGAFEADLRLYQLSTPSGQFSGIPPQNIQVGLSYNGASVSAVSPETAASKVVAKRQTATGATGTPVQLKLLQTYLFVGQIDKAQMTAGALTMARLEALVMPVVSLTAVNSAGQTVSTNVSSNEAAFVAGVFSQSIVQSDFSRAQLAVQDALLGLQNGTVAFVLPGVSIMIFPVGLIVTGTWLLLGVIAYGVGTVARIQYAENFRSRAQRLAKSSVGTI